MKNQVAQSFVVVGFPSSTACDLDSTRVRRAMRHSCACTQLHTLGMQSVTYLPLSFLAFFLPDFSLSWFLFAPVVLCVTCFVLLACFPMHTVSATHAVLHLKRHRSDVNLFPRHWRNLQHKRKGLQNCLSFSWVSFCSDGFSSSCYLSVCTGFVLF